ncbi:MAG: PAS domain-containing protein [Alphaproteobacteria bacterium]|nr:PAS domain-containing protein [Alphaproteobacteria bacterium]
MDDELREELEMLRQRIAVFDHMREGLQVVDRKLRYKYLNLAAASHGMRPREELLGHAMVEMYPGIENTEVFQHIVTCLETGAPNAMENLFEFPDGQKKWFDLRIQAVPAGVIVLSVDIDDRKRLEEEVRRAKKLEALGRLASEIAHDFGNILSAILVGVDVALFSLPEDGPEAESLRMVRDAAERGTSSLEHLLEFARGGAVDLAPLELDTSLERLVPMLRGLAEGRFLGVGLDACGAHVRADATFLDRILSNLVANAHDATEPGGRITLETRVVLGAVEIHVTDDGCGMDVDVREHVFEPFFTTKGDHGTGLGLATVYGLVKQLGGNVEIGSAPGEGTRVVITLPLVEPEG